MTVDYETVRPAPRPISKVIGAYLSGSISLADIFERVLRGWLLIVVGVILGLLWGTYNVWISRPSFTATLSLLPADTGGTGGIGGEGTTLDLIAGIAGYGSGSIPKFARFAAALSTPGVARILDQRYNMVCVAFEGQCDIKTKKWRPRTGQDAWIAGFLARLAHMPDPNGPRTVNDLAEYIGSSITLEADKKTRLITISYSDANPKHAAQFLTDVVQAGNDYIKEQDQGISRQYVDYLSRELAVNTNLSQHEALSNLLVQEERSLMLTGVNLPYAATAMDTPIVTAGNGASKLLILYGMLGLIFGAGAAFSLAFMPERLRFWSRSWNRS